MTGIEPKIQKVHQISFDKIRIPEYQRPYKWTTKNVAQLIRDIRRESLANKSAYRLGTIVFHKNNDYNEKQDLFDVVDGQQRLVTLSLIIKAIKDNQKLQAELDDKNNNSPVLPNCNFVHDISKDNIFRNYQYIKQEVDKFSTDDVNFLLYKCEMVCFALSDLSEAFQFFDSQNSRGKDLEPHDLLKAYHLREFATEELPYQAKIIDTWEDADENNDDGESKLALLFSDILFRIKNWSMLRSARYFTKSEIDLFKGINLNKHRYPHSEKIRMVDYLVNEVKHFNSINYPFQLSEPVVNGKIFFEMISHYHQVYQNYLEPYKVSLNIESVNILHLLDTYSNRNRIGDKYVRMMFDCAVLFYLDKFSSAEINQVIEKLFVWAYSLRLHRHAVQLATIDNYALGLYDGLNKGIKVFAVIKNAVHPDELLNELQQLQSPKPINPEDELLNNQSFKNFLS